MDKLVIKGKRPLRGSLPVSGSKNTALPLMAGALLGGGPTRLLNIPNLQDVTTFANVLRITGAHVDYDAARHEMTIDASRIGFPEAPYELVKKMRASFYMLGALLGRCGTARVSLPGGCAWGPRPVNLHMEGMKALGARIGLEEGYVVATAPGGRLEGGVFRMEPSSVGATINLLLAASTARGSTRLENSAREPDVVVFGEALKAMGAQIEGLGTPVIEVEGVDALHPTTFSNCPDRIELGTFMILAAIAGAPGEPVRISHARPDHLGDAFIDAFRATGIPFQIGPDRVDVTPTPEIRPVSIETDVYPGFPTDLQAQWTVLMTRAQGESRITDRIYTDRFAHIPELHRMGVQAVVQGSQVVVTGGVPISGTHVMSTDLRGSVSLVMAGLAAEGTTHVLRIYHLDRGYENLEGKLAAAGADVRRERYDEFADVPAQEMES